MNKIAIIIPARLASTRLPRKLLIKIGKHSIIQHTYLNALESKKADKVIVATDSSEIRNEITKLGGTVIMTSLSCPTGTDRCAEAAETLDNNYDIIINVQGDEPFVHPDTIDGVADALIQDPNTVMSTAKTELSKDNARNTSIVKVVCDKNDNALYFSRSPIPYPRNAEYSKWYKHLGIYGYRRNFLQQLVQLQQTRLELSESLEQLRVLENGYNIKVVHTPHDSVGIDTAEDIKQISNLNYS
ncbi:3-deoxy-manno-octulosonate cytidylyltransferase [candidate division Kazan bacterium]|uniref:3-deoxy-manno-octulosonate cytidylyltransferase n=1 Tax=candidate division Kazan bacterium TaxID=2202143 RepID=A0A420ZC14_UNCK3|nr:MAG: 3-deoxy-manno-octulosonate cytidylyltransferase [candidate division Kazan bacterium]